MREQTAGRIAFMVALVTFLVLSHYWAGWYVYHQMGFDNRFRFTDGSQVNGEILDLYVEYVARQRGYKIAVIGDSVVQGANVPQRDQTITAYLEQELRDGYLPDARVFNFGFPGGRPADIYMAINKIYQAGAVQLFVINISYPFFSDEMSKDPLLYFKVWRPYLTDEQKKELKVPAAKPGEQAQKAALMESGDSSDLERAIQEQIARHWLVYRFRQELNRYLFGGQPAVKSKEYVDGLLYGSMPVEKNPTSEIEPEPPSSEKDKPENKYKVWNSFAWSLQDREHLKKVFQVTGEENINFKYYREICRYLEENNIPAVIFMSPVNHELLQQYQLLDYDAYRAQTRRVEEVARQRGLAFFNYQEAVSADLFHDSLHLLAGGNAFTARLLSADLQPRIKEFRKRGM